MSQFTEAFERVTPELIASAWDFVDRDPRVQVIWVYLSYEDRVWIYGSFFQIDGVVVDHFDAAQQLGYDTSSEAQDALLHRDSELVNQLNAEAGPPSEIPNRMVLRFRTSDSDFAADFYYGPLQPGVPEDEQVPDYKLRDAWFERLRTTGNDSPDVTPSQG